MQVPNSDPNLDHNQHGRGTWSDSGFESRMPACVNATNLDPDPDQNPRVNRAQVSRLEVCTNHNESS